MAQVTTYFDVFHIIIYLLSLSLRSQSVCLTQTQHERDWSHLISLLSNCFLLPYYLFSKWCTLPQDTRYEVWGSLWTPNIVCLVLPIVTEHCNNHNWNISYIIFLFFIFTILSETTTILGLGTIKSSCRNLSSLPSSLSNLPSSLPLVFWEIKSDHAVSYFSNRFPWFPEKCNYELRYSSVN